MQLIDEGQNHELYNQYGLLIGDYEGMTVEGIREELVAERLAELAKVPQRHRRDIKDAREMLAGDAERRMAASAWVESDALTEATARLQLQYEKVYRRAAKRAASAYRASTTVVQAAGGPQPEEVVKAAALLESFQRLTGLARRELLKEVLQALTVLHAGEAENLALGLYLDLLADQVGVQAARLANGAQEAAADVLLDSLVEGWSVPTTADKLVEKLESIAPWQATMLARTDLISLGNGASLRRAALLDDPSVAYKTWLATPDERTRIDHRHAHGQTVPVQQPFTVSGEQLMYPGDPSASDALVINCRCSLIYGPTPVPTGDIQQIRMLGDLAVSAAGFVEGEHPRHPAGSKTGGEFAPRKQVSGQSLTRKAEVPASWEESGLAWEKKWDELPDDTVVTLFHGTDQPTAAAFAAEGIDPAKKPMTLGRSRFEAGEYAEFQPGAGLAPGLTVGYEPWSVGGYGRAMIAVRVRKGDVQVSPEQENLGATKPSQALRVNDAQVYVPILAADVQLLYLGGKEPGLGIMKQLRAAAFEESKHPRAPAGAREGGQFVQKAASADAFGRITEEERAKLNRGTTLWHGGMFANRDSIRERGLLPGGGGFGQEHPGQDFPTEFHGIYAHESDEKDWAFEEAAQTTEGAENPEDMANVYRVDVPAGHGDKFARDSEGALVYTERIPPEWITIYDPVTRKPLQGGAFDESKHPRHPEGDKRGGEFAPKDHYYGVRLVPGGGFQPYRLTRGYTKRESPAGRYDFGSVHEDIADATAEARAAFEAEERIDWSRARAEFGKWEAEMSEWYTQQQGFPPDYFPKQSRDMWQNYQEGVLAQANVISQRLSETGADFRLEPQLNSAPGGELDQLMDTAGQLTPDFQVELPRDPDGYAPGFTIWTHGDGPIEVEDVLDIMDTDYFPAGPDSELVTQYVALVDAARGLPDPTGFVTLHRGMSDAEFDAWGGGSEIPPGKFFTSIPTVQYAMDRSGAPPALYTFKVPRAMVVEIGPNEYQLKKRGRMRDGRIEPSDETLRASAGTGLQALADQIAHRFKVLALERSLVAGAEG